MTKQELETHKKKFCGDDYMDYISRWGEVFGIKRFEGEDDLNFINRILDHVRNPLLKDGLLA